MTGLLAVAAGLWAAAGVARAAETGSLEYAVKANYLYKFAPFVVWPTVVFPSAASPFTVCLFGEDPFGGVIDDAIKGQTVAGHPVAVRRLQAIAEAIQCQVLYVGRLHDLKPSEALQSLRSEPVLTVTDESQGTMGGIVHFVIRDGRVRFGIDRATAQSSGLTLSSKLLALAAPVPKSGG